MIKTRLVSLLTDSKKYIVQNVLWQWLALLAQISAVFSAAGLLEKVFTKEATSADALMTMAVILLSVLVRAVCDRLAVRASFLASADVKRVLRDRIYEKLLRLGASYKEKVSTSEIVQVSTEGVEQLETYFGRYLPQLFYSLLAPLTLFAVLSFVSLRASVVLLVCVPLIPMSIVLVQKLAKRLLSKYWGSYTKLGDSFLENLQGLTTLKIYQADQRKAAEMDEEAQNFRRITMKVLTMQLNSTSVMDIVAYGGAAVGMITACQQFLAGNLGFSGALSIILLAAEFFIPLRLLGSFFHIAMNGMAASDRIFALLDMEEPKAGTKAPDSNDFALSLRGVHFSYEKEREILKGIDLEIPAGSFVCLAGRSGCGKSTIAGLLSGKNRGYEGAILAGGEEISDIREDVRNDRITLVRHDSYLFAGSVESNLRMAKKDASEEEMIRALQKAKIWDFLKEQGSLACPVAERGSNFSGGQRQRLALARALLHDTPVYIFDEAASNVDVESEEQIMEVIRELAGTKTVILISHRLSNMTEADCICLLENGRIMESGTHKELLEQNGRYRELFENQRNLEEYGKGAQA